MRELPTVARRVFAVSILILVLIAAWSLLLRPLYRATAGAIERLNDARFELGRLEMLAEENDGLTPDELVRQKQVIATLVFPSRVDNTVFVGAVDELVRKSGVQLTELRATDPNDVGALTRFSVDLRATAREEELVQLLVWIGSHRPLLSIDHAVIMSPPASGGVAPLPLSIELRVFAFAAQPQGAVLKAKSSDQ